MTSSKTQLSPKNQEVFESLMQIAVSLGPEAKLPTVQQLRRDLGVSVMTLDSILSHLERQNVIYRRQGSGIYVSPYLHKKTIGLVCAPEFFRPGMSPFWSEMVEDMRQRASLEGEIFRFYLGLPAGRSKIPVHEDLQDDVANKRINGVFFIGNNASAVSWLEEQGIAVVNFAGRGTHKINIDYHDLIDQSIDALVQAGCRHIGLMSPFHYREENSIIRLTKAARHFEKTLKQKGLPFSLSLVWDANNITGSQQFTYQEQGFEAAWQFFAPEAAQRPDGLVIIDDMMTRGALIALQKRRVQLMRDVQIATHTNRGSAILQGHEHELIVLEVNPTEVVQGLFEMLNTLMDGQELDSQIIQIKARRKVEIDSKFGLKT